VLHPSPAAARTDRARFTRERHEALRLACVAAEAGEPSGPDTASQELPELALDERRHAAGTLCGPKKRGEMLAHDAVQNRVLGGSGAIRVDRWVRRAVRGIPRRCRERWHRLGIARRA
jgi:hypothetical protein